MIYIINKKIYIIILLMLISIYTVNSLECEYQREPLIGKIEWVCKTNETYCLSYVKYDDRLLQVNPEPEDIQGIGVIDKFEVNSGIVKVHFTKKNLRDKTNVTFGIKCGDETFEDNVRPVYKDLYVVQDRMLWARDKAVYIVVGFFLLILVIIALFFVIRRIK